jgi:hypothetical protein
MIEKYFQLYDSLVKEFHLPEDKAKEMIRVIYESSGTPMENKKQPVYYHLRKIFINRCAPSKNGC